LIGGAEEYLFDGEVPGSGEREFDDLSDVFSGDRCLRGEVVDGVSSLPVGGVVGQFGGDHAGFDEGDPDVWEELLPEGLRPPVDAPFGGRGDAR
jgi:hypothetical protein